MTLGNLDPYWGAHFLKAYSTGALHMLHEAVLKAKADDPKNVADHPDFEIWTRLIEEELSSRNEVFVKITFP